MACCLTLGLEKQLLGKHLFASYRALLTICFLIIRSVAQLSYDDVEKIMDGSESRGEEIDKDIYLLHLLATELHKHRFTEQAMSLSKQILSFDDPMKPSKVNISYKNPETASIVKEFLFLANQAVAQKISSQYPEQALLRRQSPPDNRKIVRPTLLFSV
jgi:protein SSD1